MKISKRWAMTTIAVVATALTVVGVVAAATDASPSGGPAKDPLALNGYPPKTAQIAVAITTGSQQQINGQLNVNFATGAASAQLQIPFVLSAVQVSVRALNDHLYFSNPNLTSAKGVSWFETPFVLPSLFGVSLEMVKPDVALISGFPITSVTHDGYLTTHTFTRHDVPLSSLAALGHRGGSAISLGTVTLSITTGKQGEATAATLGVTQGSSTTSVALTVLHYNRPVTIAAPPASQVRPLTKSLLKSFTATQLFKSLMLPSELSALGGSSSVA